MEIEAKEQPKHKLWKVIVGWILFVWGLIGITVNLLTIVLFDVSDGGQLAVNTIICILFIYGGWKLIHKKEVKQDEKA